MEKRINGRASIFELVEEYPEIRDIMLSLGFSEIKKDAVLKSVGRVMNLEKGSRMKGIPMEKIKESFRAHGLILDFGDGEAELPSEGDDAGKPEEEEREEKSEELLKSYLKRLSDGESLETVRADFAKRFRTVDASEIMDAEQKLMKEGTKITELQKLCDLHSALFHGATEEEKLPEEKQDGEALPAGHPLRQFARENEALAERIRKLRRELSGGGDCGESLHSLREVSIHYAKKGDLLYPLLKVRYGITGPSDVMWSVDDEIRDNLSELDGEKERGDRWKTRLSALLDRMEEMIYKETNILLPLCREKFSEEEWAGIYRDGKDYAACFSVEPALWEKGEELSGSAGQGSVQSGASSLPRSAGGAVLKEAEVFLPGGHLKLSELTALLNTIPMEISFVDAENINRFFNEGPKVFKRPGMAIDREVFSCHPPKVEPMVRSIIESFREGRESSVQIWMEKAGRTMLVNYTAVRDRDGNYLGTAELVQDMEFAKEHFLEKRSGGSIKEPKG